MTPSSVLLLVDATMSLPSAAQIASWDLLFSSIKTNFDASINDKIIMEHQMGKDRAYTVDDDDDDDDDDNNKEKDVNVTIETDDTTTVQYNNKKESVSF